MVLSHVILDFQKEYLLFALGAFVLSLLLTYLLYRMTNPPVSRAMKMVLFGLRFISLFILLFLLLEPVAIFLSLRHERPVIAVLTDNSASMSLTDRIGNRKTILDSLLRSDTIQNLSHNYDLHYYQFADVALPYYPDQEESLTVQGRATNIGGALRTVQDSLKEANLQAFILLTDGGNNVGQEPGRAVRSLKHPVFTVGVGDSTEPKDVSIVRLVTNEITYTGSEVSVLATIRNSGLEGTRVPILLKDRDTILDNQNIILSPTGGEQVVSMQYTPQKEGLQKFTVSLPVQSGETITQNNRRSFITRVLKSKIKVLLAAGSPGPELSFLKRALNQDPDIEVTPVVAKRAGGVYEAPFPKTKKDLNEFDAIVLLAFPRSHLGASLEAMIHDFVAKEGKALLMIPGQSQDTWTKYAGSQIANVLPVEIQPQGGQSGITPFTPLLTAEGLSHPVTRFDDDPTINERKWTEMPPLLGTARNCNPKSQSMVLSIHPDLKIGDAGLPFIVIQHRRNSKSMVINGLPLWRWDFLMWGIGKSGDEYVQFVTNSVRWLTTKEESEFVTITTGKRMYHSGERIDFFAQVYDDQYRSLDGAEVELHVIAKDTLGLPLENREFELSLLQTGHGTGRYEGMLRTVPPGDYRFSGTATYRGRSLGGNEGEFSVEEYSMEFSNTRMNAELLRRLSQISGGMYVTFENMDRISSELKPEKRELSIRRSFVLWEHPLLLGAFLLFVFIEWTIRKRKGMV